MAETHTCVQDKAVCHKNGGNGSTFWNKKGKKKRICCTSRYFLSIQECLKGLWWCDVVMMWWCDVVMMWCCDNVILWWCGVMLMWSLLWCGVCDGVVLWCWDDVMVWCCDDLFLMVLFLCCLPWCDIVMLWCLWWSDVVVVWCLWGKKVFLKNGKIFLLTLTENPAWKSSTGLSCSVQSDWSSRTIRDSSAYFNDLSRESYSFCRDA